MFPVSDSAQFRLFLQTFLDNIRLLRVVSKMRTKVNQRAN